MIGLKLEDSAHQDHNQITVNKSNKTEAKKLVLPYSTTSMEMVSNGTMLLVITRSQLFAKMLKDILLLLVVHSQTSKFHKKGLRCYLDKNVIYATKLSRIYS